MVTVTTVRGETHNTTLVRERGQWLLGDAALFDPYLPAAQRVKTPALPTEDPELAREEREVKRKEKADWRKWDLLVQNPRRYVGQKVTFTGAIADLESGGGFLLGRLPIATHPATGEAEYPLPYRVLYIDPPQGWDPEGAPSTVTVTGTVAGEARYRTSVDAGPYQSDDRAPLIRARRIR